MKTMGCMEIWVYGTMIWYRKVWIHVLGCMELRNLSMEFEYSFVWKL